jgi:LysM repeat protein
MRRLTPWLCVGLLLLLLTGCGRTARSEITPILPTSAPPTVTPIVAFEVTPTSAPPPALPPSLYLEPSVLNLPLGGTATVNVWVDSAWHLNTLSLEMSFNPAYVQVEDADPAAQGVQIAPGRIPQPDQVLQNGVTGTDGHIIYQVSQSAGTGADGSGIVATITLRGIAEGGTPLRFESIAATDPNGNSLTIEPLSDGLITVGMADVTPAPASTPAATPTAPPVILPTATPGAAATPIPQPTAQPSLSGTGIYYVVQPGENLYRIGLRFGTTAQAIAAASNLADPNAVSAGAMVLVPVAPPQGGYGYYVQAGDTVFSIARRFGMTVEQLAARNSIGTDYHIEVGQILSVTP